ncbi:MAG: zinc-ribbon and DUF3426 domain-containing protein [Gammaproteobacteria bacterium]|nr:zinc-ribbon and DUF3426 domain-containing protein [Gammaproteobacteria bacterium]MBU1724052.1 zinc-ribbon and DUF3426 domain-containing protein [Gammaproteobacteria bacterium]MBU2006879.1 zinc-ribbon and DUF3426 domain-containing protein [Gammaproteobacteria bacterium]
MYTQCNHCKAIFRVTMKELTAAQGLLRCGECDAIFDAMKNLSTTLPEERRFAHADKPATTAGIPATPETDGKEFGHIVTDGSFFSKKTLNPATSKTPMPRKTDSRLAHRIFSSRNFLLVGVVALALLLMLQFLYTERNWLARNPLTSTFTRQACSILGCEIKTPRDVSRINLLSRNVYSHPNTPDVLTISVSIQNDAVFAQPYPLIEISFLDKNNQVVALRRFTPEEYINNFNEDLMETGIPSELVLNISDPGEEAVRFQFRFM